VDSGTLTYTRYDGEAGHVIAVSAASGGEIEMTTGSGVQAHSVTSPDGTFIVYSQVDSDRSSVESLNLADGTVTLLNEGKKWSMIPSVSPDSARIAFTSDADGNFEIYSMEADGSDVRQLTFTDSPIQQLGPKFSPDGTQLLYASDIDEANRDLFQDLWVMPADGGPGTRLTTGLNDRESRSWSPDGTQIVVQTIVGGVGQLVVMDADGSNQRQITRIPAAAPVFSAPGVFPEMRGAVTPAWSPNGAWIAFASNHEGNYDIYLIRPDGSDLKRFTDTPEQELSVGWSSGEIEGTR
jgi:Tol biopolymer transport system component